MKALALQMSFASVRARPDLLSNHMVGSRTERWLWRGGAEIPFRSNVPGNNNVRKAGQGFLGNQATNMLFDVFGHMTGVM